MISEDFGKVAGGLILVFAMGERYCIHTTSPLLLLLYLAARCSCSKRSDRVDDIVVSKEDLV